MTANEARCVSSVTSVQTVAFDATLSPDNKTELTVGNMWPDKFFAFISSSSTPPPPPPRLARVLDRRAIGRVLILYRLRNYKYELEDDSI